MCRGLNKQKGQSDQVPGLCSPSVSAMRNTLIQSCYPSFPLWKHVWNSRIIGSGVEAALREITNSRAQEDQVVELTIPAHIAEESLIENMWVLRTD